MSEPTDPQPGEDIPVEGITTSGTDRPDFPAGAGAGRETEAATVTGTPGEQAAGQTPRSRGSHLQDLVDEPAKVMRIGTMLKQLLDEVKSAPLDDAARIRLAEIHERSIKELEDGLAPELVQELERIHLPFTENGTPSDAELRIAQAQLVGWLEGLFHGIQTALVAQQMAAQAQLTQMRRAIPGGRGPQILSVQPAPGGEHDGPGQYL